MKIKDQIDHAKLRTELTALVDKFLMELPYDARRDIAVAATGAVHLRDRVEGLVNQAILALPLKEKRNAAEGLGCKIPKKYSDLNLEEGEEQEQQKDSRGSPQR